MGKSIKCPDCGKSLRFMSAHPHQDGNLYVLMYCEECESGLDKEWEVIYNKENGVTDIHRYFFG